MSAKLSGTCGTQGASFFTNTTTTYTGFLLLIESILNCPLLHIVLYLNNNHLAWLVSCIFQISLGSSNHPFHNLLFLKLNLDKHAFSAAAPRVWNELPITLKTFETITTFRKNSRHSKLHFHRKSLVVPCSDNLRVPDIGVIEVNYCAFRSVLKQVLGCQYYKPVWHFLLWCALCFRSMKVMTRMQKRKMKKEAKLHKYV